MTLAPAKQIISITQAAASQVQKLIAAKEEKPLGIRVGVKKGGCSGLSYTFEYCYQENPADEKVEEHGVIVYVDPAAVLYIIGTSLDYFDSKTERGFKFNNPNEKAKCGCGDSFSV